MPISAIMSSSEENSPVFPSIHRSASLDVIPDTPEHRAVPLVGWCGSHRCRRCLLKEFDEALDDVERNHMAPSLSSLKVNSPVVSHPGSSGTSALGLPDISSGE